MSKELTEQWRNGTLKTGDYYITTTGLGIDDVLIGFYEGELQQFDGFCDCSIKEVLSPVPDYMDCKGLMYDSIALDKARKRIDELVSHSDELVQKMHILEKQLEIATKALKKINKKYRFTVAQDVVYKALKEMEGVK